ncbi:MAG: DUF1579 family protein [Armatimonadetes bacterium]|nr:DUF1579 family protein [Armatimonadota bacterium]
MRRFLLLTAAAVAVSARAQDDMMKMMEAAAKPGEFHQLIGKMAGDWTVEVQYKMGEMEGKSTAECHAEWILDGRFLSKKYSSEMMGQPFTVLQTVGYDTLRKEVFEWQIESNNTGRLETKGKVSDDKKTVTCTGDALDPMTMKPAKLKTVTKFVDDDTYVIEWWMKVGDAEETKQVTLTHKRKK